VTPAILTKIVLLALVACCCSCVSAEPPKPLLWKVSDADNHIYLLGSFHLLKPGDYPLAAETNAAFDDAEQLVMELSPQEINDPTLTLKMATAARLGGSLTLQQVLPHATWLKLKTYASMRGIPLATFEGYEPWFVSIVISVTEMQRFGLDPSLGLDRHFAGLATTAGKPVMGLETAAQQIALFDGMDAKVQEQSLLETLDDLEGFEQAVAKTHAQWRAGDDVALFNELGRAMKDKYPQLYQRMNVDRNISWMPRLQALLADSSTNDALVVVGSLHLLGEDGLVARLKAKGYKVERL